MYIYIYVYICIYMYAGTFLEQKYQRFVISMFQ